MTTRLYLIRHGATPHSTADRFSGASDVDLADEGHGVRAGLVPWLDHGVRYRVELDGTPWAEALGAGDPTDVTGPDLLEAAGPPESLDESGAKVSRFRRKPRADQPAPPPF